MADKLTAKQEAFAVEYVRNGRIASDAYRAHYNVQKATAKTIHEMACVLLASPKVSARIAELTAPIAAKVEKNLGLTREWVLEQLRKVAAMGMAAEPVLNADGQPVGEYKTNLAASNKALELIGKEMHQMFIDRSVNINLSGDLDRLGRAEIDAYERAIDAQFEQLALSKH